jgi:hypothetical protein
MSKKIKCLICGKYYKRLTGSHIEKIHNLSREEYLKRFPKAKLCSDEFKKKQSKMIKRLYKKKELNLRKKVGGRTFDFIKDKKLKIILQRDYTSAKKCLKYQLWKPCIVLYGSIIEAVILEYSPKAKNYYGALKATLDKKIISEIDYHKINIIRDLRNYVHLHKELSENIAIDEYWAKTFSDICESIIKRFKK